MVNKNKIIIIAVVSILSFFVFRQSLSLRVSMVETISSSVLYPLLRIQRAVIAPITQWFEHRTTMSELEHNLAQLRKTNEQLQGENNALRASHEYLYETDELRTFNKRYELCKGYTAQILARHLSSIEQFFLVDAGSDQGIEKDMVALYCNAIVGKVTQVYPWYCKVCLITDADCKVAATCVSIPLVAKTLAEGKVMPDRYIKKGIHGIHEGCNDAGCSTVRYVSHLESVEVGDTVISSGEGLIFPKGFALGKVIDAHRGELFYNITVRPLLDLREVCYCVLVSKRDISLGVSSK